MFPYYGRGNVNASVVPDVFVVLDHDLGAGPPTSCGKRASRPTLRWKCFRRRARSTTRGRTRSCTLGWASGSIFQFQPGPQRKGRCSVGYRLWGVTWKLDGTIHGSNNGTKRSKWPRRGRSQRRHES